MEGCIEHYTFRIAIYLISNIKVCAVQSMYAIFNVYDVEN